MTTAPEKPVKTGTTFHILREVKHPGGDPAMSYEPVEANVLAANGPAAIRATAKKPGRYVAIPARSFQPVTVTLEQRTVVTLAK